MLGIVGIGLIAQAIESLTTGDWVVSWDEETGELIERLVTEWFWREAPAIIDIFIGVEKISCTIDQCVDVHYRGTLHKSDRPEFLTH